MVGSEQRLRFASKCKRRVIALAFSFALIVVGAAVGARAQTAPANPVPFINQPLVPDTAAPASAGFTLTVNGTGFVSGATVKWNVVGTSTATALATTFVSSSQLTATVPATLIPTSGQTEAVTVVNPSASLTAAGGVLTSNVVFFTFIASSPFPLFANATGSPIAVAGAPGPTAAGDFTGNGKLDLAIANEASNTVTILLGNGNGTFTQASGSPIAVGTNPVSVAVGDFNGDGKLDLAVANGGSDNVTILLGNGDGTFTQASGSPVAVGIGPTSIAVGDFNGDGKLDLAVSNSSSSGNDLTILLGNGNGTFTATATSPATGMDPRSIAVGDFNGDGKLDLAVSNNVDNTVSILLGDGTGGFTAASGSPIPVGTNPRGVALADFNGDGRLDLAVANLGSNNVTILLGNGNGTFTQASGSPVAVGTAPLGEAAADLNGDGKVDLAVLNTGSQTVTILLGNGDGTFKAAASSLATGLSPAGGAIGDFNGDGRFDAVVANAGDNTVSILLQQASAPAVTLSSTGLTFSDQIIGTASAAQTVTVTNSGNANLTFGSGAVTLSGANAAEFSLSSDTCSGKTVAPAATCSVNVTFTPTLIGSASATLNFADNASGSPQTASLTGTGVSAALVSLMPTSLTFGNRVVNTTSTPMTVTLSNMGTAPLGILSITSNNTVFTQTNNCPGSLGVGASCTINITFAPTVLGVQAGQVIITDDAAGSPHMVSLSGTGVLPVSLSPTSLSFASQVVNSPSTVQPVTLSNNQTVALNISSIVGSSGFAQVNTCGTSVAAGGNCTISVYFLPTTTGSLTGTITVNDDASSSPQTISLSGTAIDAPVITFSNPEYDFPVGNEGAGNQVVGTTSAPQAILMANTGSQPLAISSIATTGDYAQTNNCPVAPATLAAGATCTINVTLTPTVVGPETGTLTVTGNASNSPKSLSLAGNGVAAGPVATVPFRTLAWKQPINSTPIPEIVPLTNTGNAALSITGISIPSPFSETNNCPASLPAGASCNITVTVTTSTLCEHDTQSLTITTNGGNPAVSMDVFGADSGLKVTDLNSQPVQNLVNALVGNGVTVSNIKYTGVPIAAGTFSGGLNIFGFDSGVILSNGSATNVIGPNCSDGITGDNNLPGDPLLTGLIGGQETNDAATLEFDFVPAASTLTFQYAFASDEYNEFVYSFNDVFGLFVNGVNVAMVLGTHLPVSINGVNGGNPVGTNATNPQDYINNEFFYGGPTPAPLDTEMDGVTKVFTAKAQVNPGVTNHIKLAVADARDHVLDTNVFIEGSSISSTSVAFSPPSLGFGSVNIGMTSAAQTVTLTNSGTTAVTISSIQASGDFAQTNNCPLSPSTLAPAGTCTLTVTFAPTAAGQRSGTITITDNAPGSPQTVPLTGTGVQPPVAVQLSTASITFTNTHVGLTCDPQTVTLTNTGSAPLTISSIVSSSAIFPIEGDTCPMGSGSLAAGASCTITVKFAPKTQGSQSGTLTITDNAPNSPQQVALQGTGLAPCALFAAVKTQTVVRGTATVNFAVTDPSSPAQPSCFAAPIHMSCLGQGPMECAFNPEDMPPGGTTQLTVGKVSALTTDAQTFQAIGQATPTAGAVGLQQAGVVLALEVEDFSLSPYPTTAAITAGQSASYEVAVVPVNGLAGPVSLTCGGAPAGATCSVTPSEVTLANSLPVEVAVRVTTTARSHGGPLTAPRLPLLPLGVVGMLGLLLAVTAMSSSSKDVKPVLAGGQRALLRRTGQGLRLALAALMMAVALWTACGGGGIAPSTLAPSTPAGTYNLIVTGTYTSPAGASTPTSFSNTASLTLNVN